MAISATYRIHAVHPTGQKGEMEIGTLKGAMVYAERAQLRGYDVLVVEELTKDGETTRRTFLDLKATIKPPFGEKAAEALAKASA